MNAEALRGLRLRTPRLELRLASHDELVALSRVAEAGIHLPEEMPFEIAWTDDLDLDAFVEFHRIALETWSPDAWRLHFVVFENGRPIGDQSVEGERFAEERIVKTGSWLGQAYQRRGVGTEMRAAVLELAFRGLGAKEAWSGALAGNDASLGVSRKLGYRKVGQHEVAPRGVPVPHDDLVLDRASWTPRSDVEIEGLEPALPLFGV